MKSTIIVSLALILAIFYMNTHNLTVYNLEEMIGSHKVLAPLIFSIMYIFILLTGLPISTVFFLGGGFLFGLINGIIIVLLSSTVGAILCFLVARFVFKDIIQHKFSHKVNIVLRGVEQDGWKFVALTRLIIVIPLGLSSYLLGITNISLLSFSLATFFAEIPAVVSYSYVGSLGREIIKGNSEYFVFKFLFAIGLISFLSAIPLVIKHIKLFKSSYSDDLS